MKIKIEKLEKINAGTLYVYYRAQNIETGEVRTSESSSYYGDDILNISSFTEAELTSLPLIYGKKYSDEKIVWSEIHEYSDTDFESELKAEAWSDEIYRAIQYVML